jgi:lambda family phage tail tape measure protein
VVKFFQDRFKGRGMSTQGADLLTLYRTVLGGNPTASLTRTDGNKVTPASGVARMGPHRQKALRMFFGGSMENVGYDLAQAGADQVQGREETAALQKTRADQLASARELLATNQGLLQVAQATGPAAKLLAEFEAERAERARRYAELLKGVNGNPDAQAAYNAAEAAEAGRAEITYREDLKRITEEQLDLDRQRNAEAATMLEQMQELTTRQSAGTGFKQGIQEYYDSIGNLRDSVSALTVTGFKGLEDAAMSLATNGPQNFNVFASSILADTGRMIFRTFVLKTIMEAIGAITKTGISTKGAFGPAQFDPGESLSFAAKGATFANGIAKFARGGAFTNSIVNTPTMFRFASGGAFRAGVMGEAGPEAIMPLRRDNQGRLGVSAQGGTTSSTQVNIAVHVHPNGNVTSNSDGSGSAQALGNDLARMLVPMVGPMVDRQLQRHMERGGLLNR